MVPLFYEKSTKKLAFTHWKIHKWISFLKRISFDGALFKFGKLNLSFNKYLGAQIIRFDSFESHAFHLDPNWTHI